MKFDVNAIATQIADRIFEDATNRMGEGDLDCGSNAELEHLVEKHFEEGVSNLQLSEGTWTWLYGQVRDSREMNDVLDEIRLQAREHREDAAAYYESPMQYYGLKQRDFI